MGFDAWWVPDVPLDDGEQVALEILANHTVSRWRAVGGKLALTDRRLRFRPNRVDRSLGGEVWSVPLDQIADVGRQPRTWNLFDGGLRTRLRVTTRDGAAHLFVVNRLGRVVDAIAAARGGLPV
ncbi:MAG: hypothetical protein KC464_25475 [Myxococcales bacterium]|nr:hypothetical protein [Myxococcales bacterium]